MTPPSRLRVRALADALVDPEVGVIEALSILPPDPGAPHFFHASAELGDLSGCGWRVGRARSDGAAASRERAAMRAIAGAIGRYCAAFFEPRDLPLASARALPLPCAAPAPLAPSTAAPGSRLAPLSAEARVRWALVEDAASGEPCYAPASAVVFPYQDEGATAPPSAAGLACAEGLDEAAVAAICGVILADTLEWVRRGRAAQARIRLETLPDREYDLAARFERTAGAPTLLDVTGELGVPVILAALRCGAPGAPALLVAGGAAPEPAEAARDALEELALIHRAARGGEAGACPVEPPGVESTLLASPRRADLDQLPALRAASARAMRDALVRAVARAGRRVLLADLTTSDARGLGLAVVRAIAGVFIDPGLGAAGPPASPPRRSNANHRGGDHGEEVRSDDGGGDQGARGGGPEGTGRPE